MLRAKSELDPLQSRVEHARLVSRITKLLDELGYELKAFRLQLDKYREKVKKLLVEEGEAQQIA